MMHEYSNTTRTACLFEAKFGGVHVLDDGSGEEVLIVWARLGCLYLHTPKVKEVYPQSDP